MPKLGYNLLSVGQLISSGYSLLFGDGKCTIMDKKSGHILMHVSMTKNMMFPLDVPIMAGYALATKGEDDSQIRQLRYGNLNFNSLQVLKEKGMFIGLPKIENIKLFKRCIYG